MSDMTMNGPVGRSYRYYTGPTLWPFGWCLSLTRFTVTKVAGSPDEFNVANVGERTGDEVVMAFISPPGYVGSFARRLAGFQRVHLSPGQSVRVSVPLPADGFNVVNQESGVSERLPGDWTVEYTNGVDQRLRRHISIA